MNVVVIYQEQNIRCLDNDTVNVVFDNLSLQACGHCRDTVRSNVVLTLARRRSLFAQPKLCGTLPFFAHAFDLGAARACSLSSGKRVTWCIRVFSKHVNYSPTGRDYDHHPSVDGILGAATTVTPASTEPLSAAPLDRYEFQVSLNCIVCFHEASGVDATGCAHIQYVLPVRRRVPRRFVFLSS